MRPSLLPSRPRKPLFGSSSTSYSTSSSTTPNSSSAASSASAIVRPVVSTHSMVMLSPLRDGTCSPSPLVRLLVTRPGMGQRRLRFLLFRRRALELAPLPEELEPCVELADVPWACAPFVDVPLGEEPLAVTLFAAPAPPPPGLAAPF